MMSANNIIAMKPHQRIVTGNEAYILAPQLGHESAESDIRFRQVSHLISMGSSFVATDLNETYYALLRWAGCGVIIFRFSFYKRLF